MSCSRSDASLSSDVNLYHVHRGPASSELFREGAREAADRGVGGLLLHGSLRRLTLLHEDDTTMRL